MYERVFNIYRTQGGQKKTQDQKTKGLKIQDLKIQDLKTQDLKTQNLRTLDLKLQDQHARQSILYRSDQSRTNGNLKTNRRIKLHVDLLGPKQFLVATTVALFFLWHYANAVL